MTITTNQGVQRLTKGQIVDGYRDVLTQGHYMGEEGTGYGWGTLPSYGDYSGEMRGRMQGYTEPVKIEILAERADLVDLRDEGHDLLLWLPKGTQVPTSAGILDLDYHGGLTVPEAIEYGFARIVTK
jgi:hypothetical protein